MIDDLLEQLAHLEVQPPPAAFDRELHERVNRSLLTQHLLDLCFGALPWAVAHFARAVAALAAFTLCGRYGNERRKDER
jgi:hypothetical protein